MSDQPTIELRFKLHDRTIVVDPAAGEFLAISRFFIHREGRRDFDPLVYEIIKRLTPAEFYAILGDPIPSTVSLDALSDHLVRAFDARELQDRSGLNCMFVWRNPEGLTVTQHST